MLVFVQRNDEKFMAHDICHITNNELWQLASEIASNIPYGTDDYIEYLDFSLRLLKVFEIELWANSQHKSYQLPHQVAR